MQEMKNVVEEAKKAGIREKVKIMVGGAPLNEDFCRETGADLYTPDAATAAEKAVELIGR
jgi:methanogenic corrinoid protein MtbC1